MSRNGEKVSALVGVGILTFGSLACASDKDVNEGWTFAERAAEIDKLEAEIEVAKIALTASEVEQATYTETLSDDCEQIIQPYMRPDGKFVGEFSVAETAERIADWCEPEHADAVEQVNGMYQDRLATQIHIGDLEWWIAANVAASQEFPVQE